MTDKTPTLSGPAQAVLTRAAASTDRLASFSRRLPSAARNRMIAALLTQTLLEETAGPYQAALLTEQDDGMLRTTLRITDAGFRAVGMEPPARPAPAMPGDTLRAAAQAVLDAWRWDAPTNRTVDVTAAMAAPLARLRAALARPRREGAGGAARGPRQGTKQEQVLAMLRRAEGASGPQIADETGWNSNTVRGFLAGLKKKGVVIEVLERVRQLGPNKAGARGSFTVYSIPAAAPAPARAAR